MTIRQDGRAPLRAAAGKLAVATLLSVYLHVALEWLFFVTKPSFMETMLRAERVRLLLTTPLPVVIFLAGVGALLCLASGALPGRVLLAVGRTVPAAIFALCVFILIDNFTYTLFGWGVVSTGNPERFAYLALLLALFVLLYRALAPTTAGRAGAAVAGCLLVASLMAALWQVADTPAPPALTAGSAARQLPNIIIVGTDGVEAGHLSAYGYERPTTPFLTQLMQRALVIENVFPNANSSAGSVAAMIIGKHPLRTHLLQYPDILMGVDSYQHLPGVLRGLGYSSIAMTMPVFVDPFNANMENSYDAANFRSARRRVASLPFLPGSFALAFAPPLYFLGEIEERVTSRVLHAAGIRTMTNAYAAVTTAGAGWPDEDRINAVLEFLQRSPKPVFAHMHLMGTHLPLIPRTRLYSVGVGQTRKERRARVHDLYDDVIADFDRDLQLFVERLERTGKLANTVLVITSDHGHGWTYARLPLVFVFPGGEPRGRRTVNAQLIDVAPTLLDYLGVPVPPWMDGESLLRDDLDPMRRILSVDVRSYAPPPFPKIQRVGITVCRTAYWVDPRAAELSIAEVPGSTAPCDAPMESEWMAGPTVRSALRDNGYDVSSWKIIRRARTVNIAPVVQDDPTR
jgi:arylsulfatase A-like enzyme